MGPKVALGGDFGNEITIRGGQQRIKLHIIRLYAKKGQEFWMHLRGSYEYGLAEITRLLSRSSDER